MRFQVRLTGRDEPLLVEIVSDDGDAVEVLVDEQPIRLSMADLSGDRLLVNRDGQVELIDALGADGTYEILRGTESHELVVVDELDTWLGVGGDADGGGAVSVAMPGKVVAIDVAEGDAVVKGQRLLVVEAMKMENDVKSPRDGVVLAVRVAVGDAVEGGQPLIDLE